MCLGRAAVCDCGTPWTFLLPFFVNRYKGAQKCKNESFDKYFQTNRTYYFIRCSVLEQVYMKHLADHSAHNGDTVILKYHFSKAAIEI